MKTINLSLSLHLCPFSKKTPTISTGPKLFTLCCVDLNHLMSFYVATDYTCLPKTLSNVTYHIAGKQIQSERICSIGETLHKK